MPKTSLIRASTTKNVSKSFKTVEKEDSGCQGLERCLDRNPDWKSFIMVCVLLSRSIRRAADEEPNPAAKVDRTSQGTDSNSSGDHRFRRRREFAPARGNNSQAR